MDIEIKTEIPNEDEETALQKKPIQHTTKDFLTSSTNLISSNNKKFISQGKKKLQQRVNIPINNMNDTPNRDQQMKKIPQLHYYNLKRSSLAISAAVKDEALSHNVYIPGTRCGEIFVANNARKWTFMCTFCNKSTRDIGDFVLHLKKRHLSSDKDGDAEMNSDSQQSMDGIDDTYVRTSYNSATDQDVSKIFRCEFKKESTVKLNNNIYNNVKNEQIRYNSSATLINYSRNSLNNNLISAIIPTNIEHGANSKATTLLIKKSFIAASNNNLQDKSRKEPSYITNAAKSKTTTGTTEYVDCGSYLDVNVHTDPVELNYNNNNRISQSIENNKPVQPKKGCISKKVHSHEEKETVHEKLIGNNAKLLKKKKTNTKPINTINGDVNSQDSLEGNEADNGSSAVDYTDFEQDSNYQDDAIWPGLSQYEDDEPGTVDADPDQEDGEEADEDFDNQLFIPPADPQTNDMKVDNANLRTVRRQIRGPAFCVLCNKTFQYYSLYRNHMTKHSNETPFKCVLCKKGFKSKQAIRYHMHTHQKEKRHKCQLCHAAYYTESQVITHVLSHENGSIFPCMVCGKILRSDPEREHHLSTHTEERPFRCEYCNKLFRLRHHLSNHLKIHRQYRCDFCKAEFTSAVHQRKPYA